MQFSRFVFGVGGESLSVAQNTYASAWFRGDALNMVFGLQVREFTFTTTRRRKNTFRLNFLLVPFWLLMFSFEHNLDKVDYYDN
jgi:hypothetical protein